MINDWLNLSWKLLIARGVLAILFGIVAVAWPIETALALAVVWGIWALLDGIGSFVQAFDPLTPRSGKVLLVIMGVIALVAAFFAIFSPGVTAKALTWMLGIWLIVRACFELAGAFASTLATPRWLLVLSGAIDLLLGILFVTNPGGGAVGIAVVLGITAIAWGVVFVVVGFMARDAAESTAYPRDATA